MSDQKKLLLLSLSPVQGFIEQARKSKDLFAGSAVLSKTMLGLAEKLKEYDAEIIFPSSEETGEAGKEDHENQESFFSAPNRILAKIPSNKTEDLRNFLDCENNKEGSVFKLLYTQFGMENFSYDDQKKLKKDIRDFFNFSYVIVPLDKGYKTAYHLAEKYFASVKSSRGFLQSEQKSGESRCTLCGERNAVKSPLSKNLRLDEKEKLCILCAAKRAYKDSDEKKNPQMNEQPNEQGNPNPEKKEVIDNQEESRFPSTAFFALLEEINKVKLEEWVKKNPSNDLQNVLEESKERKKALQELGLEEKYLNKYYALLLLDGDNMGKHFSAFYSGKEGGEKVDTGLEEYQKAFSKALKDFAKESERIVNTYGKTVYAGGDDLMGFLPFSKALNLQKDLDKAFQETVVLKKTFSELQKPSFSSSLVFAHYKSPLNQVLKYARTKLKTVKERYKKLDKNGISLTFITKSNKIRSAFLRRNSFLKDYLSILNILKGGDTDQKTISSRFIAAFFREADSFSYDRMNYDEYCVLRDLFFTEFKRFAKRSLIKTDKTSSEKNIVEELKTAAENLFIENVSESKANLYSLDYENFKELFFIVEKLSKKELI